jgi:hypothetical protein
MAKRTDWADADDDEEGDDDNVEIGGSTVAKVGSQANPVSTTESAGRTFMPAQPMKPRVHRERNIHGDFVVTKINVRTKEAPVIEHTGDTTEEEPEEESSEEEEEPARAPEEEVKKGKQQFFSHRDLDLERYRV